MSKQIDSRLIGQTIRHLREEHRWSQQDLADIIGYSDRQIRRIETDGTTNIEVVNNFAELFEVSAFDILNGCLLFLFLDVLVFIEFIDVPGFRFYFCRPA